jgi:hypothetical protein
MKHLKVLLISLVLATGVSHAATINAASPSSVDVQSALNQAQAGDTVVIPAGQAAWTQGVSWEAPANVTVKGAGSTVIGGGDNTVIIDNFNSGGKLLEIKANSSGLLRLTGITVKSGSATSAKDGGTISIAGPGKVRIDHCHFVASVTANYKMVIFWAGVFGVMDQCVVDLTGTNALYFSNGRQGPGDWMGNLEWTFPTNFGSQDYFYIEDNIINGNVGGGAYSTRIFDGLTSAKVVARFNNVSQATLAETHATGHAGDDRGLRSQEVYGNRVTSSLARDPNFVAVDIANGTTLVWGNSWNNVYKNLYTLKVTRANDGTYRQGATPNG